MPLNVVTCHDTGLVLDEIVMIDFVSGGESGDRLECLAVRADAAGIAISMPQMLQVPLSGCICMTSEGTLVGWSVGRLVGCTCCYNLDKTANV